MMAGCVPGQEPGQPGIDSDASDLFWRCPVSGCNTLNFHDGSVECANCSSRYIGSAGCDAERNLAVIVRSIEQATVVLQSIAGKSVVLIIGGSGVGKSTVLNFLAGCTLEHLNDTNTSVVVKLVAEGGDREPVVSIDRGTQACVPQVVFDPVTEWCFCEFPEMLDNSIATIANLNTALSNAKDVRVLVVFRYSVLHNQDNKFERLLARLVRLFGSVGELTEHVDSVFIGCTCLDQPHTLEEIRADLSAPGNPQIIQLLVNRVFLLDLLNEQRGDGRALCLEQIKSMPSVASGVFCPVMLGAADEKKLIAMSSALVRKIETHLPKGDYRTVFEAHRQLLQLSVLKHLTVEKQLHRCYVSIWQHFAKEISMVKQHCLVAAFAKADSIMQTLRGAADLFNGEDWADILPFAELTSFVTTARTQHKQQVHATAVLTVQLKQANARTALMSSMLELRSGGNIRQCAVEDPLLAAVFKQSLLLWKKEGAKLSAKSHLAANFQCAISQKCLPYLRGRWLKPVVVQPLLSEKIELPLPWKLAGLFM